MPNGASLPQSVGRLETVAFRVRAERTGQVLQPSHVDGQQCTHGGHEAWTERCCVDPSLVASRGRHSQQDG